MHSKISFYRFIYILNILACIVFTGFVVYQVFNSYGKITKNDIPGFILMGSCLLIYLLSDLAGLNLVKKLKQNEGLSRIRVIWIGIVLLLQIILQILLAYGIYLETCNILNPAQGLNPMGSFTRLLLFLDGLLFTIFITSIYAILFNLGLVKKVWKNQTEFEQIVAEIGSSKKHSN